MGGLTALTFAAPWVLAALAVLPVIWWLLKVNPPAPRRIRFPAVRLLLDMPQREETPAKTPLWLIILRMVLAALIILALARPLMNPAERLYGSGPVVLVADDGWAAAPRWDERVEAMEAVTDRADREGRAVVVVTTAPRSSRADGDIFVSDLLRPGEARDVVRGLQPRPWPVDRAAASAALDDLDTQGSAHVVWFSNGITARVRGRTSAPSDDVDAFARKLQRLGALTLVEDRAGERAHLLLAPERDSTVWEAQLLRADTGPALPVTVRLMGDDGRLLARETVAFDEAARRGSKRLDLPAEITNAVTRMEIEGEGGAGGVVLIDDRWRRRPVGLVSGEDIESAQPLLGALYYVERALAPYAEVRRGAIDALLQRDLAVMVLADVGRVVGESRDRLAQWIDDGGVLLRFAGPRLADGADDLVPVALRGGGSRSLGGALSWDQPMPLSPFAESSPFFGLDVPPDVVVDRQVLADPSLDLGDRTWARLADGTPLVTAARRGEGWLVLFHTTANADWSNLSLSGTFVQMLRRVVEMSEGIAGEETSMPLPALRTLDGFGRLVQPSAAVTPLAPNRMAETVPGPTHPPGYYGNDAQRRALNLSSAIESIAPLPAMPAGVKRITFEKPGEIDLMPWLLTAAAILALIDIGISLWIRGLTTRAGAAAAAVALLAALFAGIGAPPEARAQESVQAQVQRSAPTGLNAQSQQPTTEQIYIESANETRLAYYVTGDPEIDSVSRAGLYGLGMILYRRTAVEPGPPIGVDPETDDITFFPLIYWPVTADQKPLSSAASKRLDSYLKAGGTVLFDTRDQAPEQRIEQLDDIAGDSPLGRMLAGLDLPPLIPVPEDHALRRTFYLLDSFPGRWAGGRVWVERYEGGANDGVSSIIIGGNDWAGAWALDDRLAPLLPVVPGGERQREMAFRFGVNVAMYALTGNYKADQVHLPVILERLGLQDAQPGEEDR